MTDNKMSDTPKKSSGAARQAKYKANFIAKYGREKWLEKERSNRAKRKSAKNKKDIKTVDAKDVKIIKPSEIKKTDIIIPTKDIQIMKSVAPEIKNGLDDMIKTLKNKIEEIKNQPASEMPKLREEQMKMFTQQLIELESKINCSKLVDYIMEKNKKLLESGTLTKGQAKNIPKSKKVVERALKIMHNLYVGILGGKAEKFMCKKNHMELFKDYDKVINFINTAKSRTGKSKGKKYSLNTKRDFVAKISSIIKHLSGYEEVYLKYLNSHRDLREKVIEKIDENILTESEKENYLKWEDVLKVRPNIKDDRSLFIYDIYTDKNLAPRRKSLFRLLVVVKDTKKNVETDNKKYPTDKNYLIVNKKGEPIHYVLKNYKTYKDYGVYTSPRFSKATIQSGKKYIKGKKEGDLVFPTKDGKIYSASSFNLIKQLFEKYGSGKAPSTNLLRHSFVSYNKRIGFKGKRLSGTMIKKLATLLGHSKEKFMEYDRIDELD